MEKRIWSKPEMHEFAFAANEYVSTCYSGKCDTRAGWIRLGFPEGIWAGAKDLYKLFFSWIDTGDSVVQKSEVDLTKVVNDYNIPCNENFNEKGSYQSVASPDTLFYRDDNNVWKSVDEITDDTEWTKAYHFEGHGTTHLCGNLKESGKS